MRDEEFKRATADVSPLKPSRRAELRAPRPAPVPTQRRRDEKAVLKESLAGPLSEDDALETGEELAYLRVGLSRQVLRRLRRGHWSIQAALDLHGQTREQAAESVAAFLEGCAVRGLRCVRIVHGKGLGILRAKLGKWLPRRDEVLAFCQAPARDGGSGALLVLLKGKR